MLNCGCKCLIFSELSGSKIELFDFWIISGILSGCLGVVTNILPPKQFANYLKINKLPQRGAGVTAENEPKRAGATLKNFFHQIHKVGPREGGQNSVEGSCSR